MVDKWVFRGWDAVGEKGWVYGDLVHNQKVTETGLEPRVMVGGYEVVPESVGLWTGLKDKNGKEIFDGDWVLLEGVGVFNVRYSTSMCQFGLYGERGFVDALKELQADRYEVVGNIISGHKNEKENGQGRIKGFSVGRVEEGLHRLPYYRGSAKAEDR